MAIQLTNEERETMLNMTADDRGVWVVYSDDPVMIRKLESIGARLTKAERDGVGRHYELSANQVTLRRPITKRSLTAEEKAAQALRLQKMRQARNALSIDSK